jgi:hypothetical protein
MPRTRTDAELEKAEAVHAQDPERAEVIARVRRFKAGWYELAEVLVELRRSERWRRWGHASFEDYCRKELHLRRDTVDKLTGSFSFLSRRAPEALRRDGRDEPIPSYQAVDFWRRAEEEAEAPAETVEEIRREVLDEGASLPRLSRVYRQVVFPVEPEEDEARRRKQLKQAVDRLIEQLAHARADGAVPDELCAEIEEPLARLAAHLSAGAAN